MIGKHVFSGAPEEGSALVGDGIGRVAEIGGDAGLRGLVHGEFSVGLEVKGGVAGGFGRPFVKAAPGVVSTIEHCCFGEGSLASSAEKGVKEWEFNFFLKELAGVGAPVVDVEFLTV